jgi:outer membrane receptor protein involved in Fe transport
LPIILGDGNTEEEVTYPAVFFDRYQPNTALDMVQQVPGFQLDDGGDLRGFGGAAGNILINDRRPSAKQDLLSAILARIPASYVERINIIRGQVQGVDLQGQTVVANIVLFDNVPAAIRWDALVRKNFNAPPITADISMSFSDRWKDIDYIVGVGGRRSGSSFEGFENEFNDDRNLAESRIEDDLRINSEGDGNLNASTIVGETLVHLNTKLAYKNRSTTRDSRSERSTTGSIPHDELFNQSHEFKIFELGVDGERSLSRYLDGKAIFLFNGMNVDIKANQHNVDSISDQTLLIRRADTDTDTREVITRLEFDWVKWSDHVVQANFEVTYNVLDGSLVQTENTGAGPVLVDVPGANTRVDETRWDFLLRDTWSLADFVLDYGLGAEFSTITQTGDSDQKRNFVFLKPQSLLTYSPKQGLQTRLRLAREVAQLNFNEFVSSTVFDDDDLALGNPDLKPETTWIIELSQERRFGELGVVTLTAFHHWISDVQDLLPLTPEFEVPGNIGDGRRWGFELESTIPLEWLKLSGAKLDLKARWQDSTVTDPVTGEDRELSGNGRLGGMPFIPFRDKNDDYEYIFDIAYRQDFDTAQVAWGWDIAERAERLLFKVNELDIIDEGELEFNAFVETTRWWGLKIRLLGENILNLAEVRDRTKFIGERNSTLTDIEGFEFRYRTKGFRLTLLLSGSF